MSRMLVIGARPGSLGEAVCDEARSYGLEVAAAGVAGETIHLNAVNARTVEIAMQNTQPHHVVCTVGINYPVSVHGGDWLGQVANHLQVNVFGVATVLQHWLYTTEQGLDTEYPGHFVAVSSNSAHIARRQSAPYCASKAALSMMIRCAAREMADDGGRRIAYAYEPGLLATSQTEEVRRALGDPPMHRMPGQPASGLSRKWLARLIVRNVLTEGAALNGTTIRLDGGEQ